MTSILIKSRTIRLGVSKAFHRCFQNKDLSLFEFFIGFSVFENCLFFRWKVLKRQMDILKHRYSEYPSYIAYSIQAKFEIVTLTNYDSVKKERKGVS